MEISEKKWDIIYNAVWRAWRENKIPQHNYERHTDGGETFRYMSYNCKYHIEVTFSYKVSNDKLIWGIAIETFHYASEKFSSRDFFYVAYVWES